MATPNAPSIAYIAQVSTGIGVGVRQSLVTADQAIVSYNLYRSLTGSSPWTLVASSVISATLLTTLLVDSSPVLGLEVWYAATSVDALSAESARSSSWTFSAAGPEQVGAGSSISSAAFGPFPLLGSDVFIDPDSGQAVIGPNGDLVTVNGLACLAQDLRIRMMTTPGELPLHPLFGFPDPLGHAQAEPEIEAQILAANLKDTLVLDPRVAAIL